MKFSILSFGEKMKITKFFSILVFTIFLASVIVPTVNATVEKSEKSLI
jgi:hypothetical protein